VGIPYNVVISGRALRKDRCVWSGKSAHYLHKTVRYVPADLSMVIITRLNDTMSKASFTTDKLPLRGVSCESDTKCLRHGLDFVMEDLGGGYVGSPANA